MTVSNEKLGDMSTVTIFAKAGEHRVTKAFVQGRARDILLVLHTLEPDPFVLTTVFSLMERLDAGVEVLLRTDSDAPSLTLKRFLEDVARSERNGRLIYRPGLSWKMVVHHAESFANIVCILVESLEKWGLKNDPESKRRPAWSNRLPCPLVVTTL